MLSIARSRSRDQRIPNYPSKRRVVGGTWPGQTPSIGHARAAGATRAARAHLGRCGVCCAHGAASEHRAPSRAQARPGSASRLDDASTVRVGPGSEAIFLRPNERSLGWLERRVGSADEARGQETRQKQRHARQAGQPKGPHSPPSRCPGRSRRRAVRARRNSCSDGHSAAAAGRESDKRDAPCGDWRGRPPVLAFQ